MFRVLLWDCLVGLVDWWLLVLGGLFAVVLVGFAALSGVLVDLLWFDLRFAVCLFGIVVCLI